MANVNHGSSDATSQPYERRSRLEGGAKQRGRGRGVLPAGDSILRVGLDVHP